MRVPWLLLRSACRDQAVAQPPIELVRATGLEDRTVVRLIERLASAA